MMKTVFVVMCAEFLHPGHVNIIKVARELGEVTVGLATDEFNARYKRLSLMSYEQRKVVVENIKGVKRVIPQETLDLPPVLRALKPDYFVHGDDWKTGSNQEVRQKVMDVLKEWGGTLVEPPYTEGVSSTQLDAAWRTTGTTPELRRQRFRRLLAYLPVVRILEVHDALTGRVAERAQVKVGGKSREFDAMWVTMESSASGNTGNGSVVPAFHENTLRDILMGTTKPLIVDAINGGQDFSFAIKTLERLGASAAVVDEAANSDGGMPLARVQEFAHKISSGLKDNHAADFSIIVRLHSLTINQGGGDALFRAQAYAEAGADALMIQGRSGTYDKLFDFCRLYARLENKVPLLTPFPASRAVHEHEWVEAGIKGFLYSDQHFRAAYANLMKAAETLLSNHPGISSGQT